MVREREPGCCCFRHPTAEKVPSPAFKSCYRIKSLFPGDSFKGNATNATAKFDAFSASALKTSLPGTDDNAGL